MKLTIKRPLAAATTALIIVSMVLFALGVNGSYGKRSMSAQADTYVNFKCPKCGSDMEAGTTTGCMWVRGRSGFGKVIASFRCTKCGFLESYAN